jgi:exopolyphosphatase/guanosine-5'-triphosphate,3'-diphosphate pyrophosphatase
LKHEGRAVAVIDIGSNSGRVVVFRVEPDGRLRILASTRASLRLVRDLDERHRLGADAVARTLDALHDFRAIAVGAGASDTMAVATAAVREAENGEAFIERVRREVGIEVEVIDGEREAHYGFVGAVRGLPVEHGVQFDMGGGSMQLTRFRNRRRLRSWSLPLGSLRLSDSFLASDPPSRGEIRRLQQHVGKLVARTRIGVLKRGEFLVGTGGTVRNMAKVDRRRREYPIVRLHGYVLSRRRAEDVSSWLASRKARARGSVPGLSEERGDSIVGGSLGVHALMEVLGASELHVSGQGVREGLASSAATDELPPSLEVRQSSVAGLVLRFAGWNASAAARRASVAAELLRVIDPRAPAEVRECLGHAATVLDIGSSVDFFDRHQHVARILLATDLNGFSHRLIALTAAIVHNAGDEGVGVKPYAPLLKQDDRDAVARAAVVLALADDIEERCAPGAPLTLDVSRHGHAVVVVVPKLLGWRPRRIAERFREVFARELVVAKTAP